MKNLFIILVALLFNSCATTKPTVIKIYPDGRSTVVSPDSAMVHLNKDGERTDSIKVIKN